MAKRQCKGTNREGEPCQAAPMRGGDYCSAHDTVAPAFGTPEQSAHAGAMGGRPRLIRPSEIAQRLIEDNALAIQRPYWEALGFDVEQLEDGGFNLVAREGGPVKAHTTFRGDFFFSDSPDLGAMQDAADRLQDRAYGKPKQATEITGADGGPIQTEARDMQADLSKLSKDELREYRELRAKMSA